MTTNRLLRINNKEIVVKAVGFDKDGTLFDAVSFWAHIDQLRKHQFLTVVGEEYADLWGKVMGFKAPDLVDHQGLLAVANTMEEIIVTAGLIYQLKGWPWTECKTLAESIFRFSDQNLRLQQAFRPRDRASEVIIALKKAGWFTGILTSDKRARTEDCMNLLGVKEHLDFLITPEVVEKGKPSPDMVYKACTQINISPEEIAVIGDSIVDIQMAKAAGSIAIGIVTHEGSREILSQEADIVIESLYDIEIGYSI
jgi:phosphoglycolate phosphatase